MEPQAAERLVEARAVTEIQGAEEVMDILGAGYPLLAPYIEFKTADASAVFTVEAMGYTTVQGKGYLASATVGFERPPQYRYLRYKSPAEH
jgi:hypothetical protein